MQHRFRSIRQNVHVGNGLFSVFWNRILDRFNTTSKQLQSEQMDLNTAVVLLQSLEFFVQSQRDQFDEFERMGAQMSGTSEYRQQNQRIRRRNVRMDPLDYAKTAEVQLSDKERFRAECFLPVIDKLLVALSTRISAYADICQRFGFLKKLTHLAITTFNQLQ